MNYESKFSMEAAAVMPCVMHNNTQIAQAMGAGKGHLGAHSMVLELRAAAASPRGEAEVLRLEVQGLLVQAALRSASPAQAERDAFAAW